MLSKCMDSAYLVGATPPTVFHRLFWNIADAFYMEWRCACGLSIILWLFFFSHVFCFVFFCMKCYQSIKTVGTLWAQLLLQFSTDCLKLCRCFLHGMKIFIFFWYKSLIIFSHFFCYMNLVLSFLVWNAGKVDRQWVPCGRKFSYSFPQIVLKFYRCFLLGINIWFWYNTLIIFCSLFLLCELSLFFDMVYQSI